jgi:hypothetical protein
MGAVTILHGLSATAARSFPSSRWPESNRRGCVGLELNQELRVMSPPGYRFPTPHTAGPTSLPMAPLSRRMALHP